MEATLQSTKQHCSVCGSPATMDAYPSPTPGLWVCENDACGASDFHEHARIVSSWFNMDTVTNGEHDEYQEEGHYCEDCGASVN